MWQVLTHFTIRIEPIKERAIGSEQRDVRFQAVLSMDGECLSSPQQFRRSFLDAFCQNQASPPRGIMGNYFRSLGSCYKLRSRNKATAWNTKQNKNSIRHLYRFYFFSFIYISSEFNSLVGNIGGHWKESK